MGLRESVMSPTARWFHDIRPTLRCHVCVPWPEKCSDKCVPLCWAHAGGIKYHQRRFTTPSSRVNPRYRCEKTLPTFNFDGFLDFELNFIWWNNDTKLRECTHIIGLACLNAMFRFDFSLIYVLVANALAPLSFMFTRFNLLWKRFPGIKRNC